MAKDDYSVVVYKVLAYLYQSIKEGVYPNIIQTKEITGINEVYLKAVVADLADRGYVRFDMKFFPNGEYRGLSITGEGVEYLEENPKMASVKSFLGKAFDVVVAAMIEAAKAI